MSAFTDMYLGESNRNEAKIIELIKSIDDKLTYLCGAEYKAEQEKNKKAAKTKKK